MCVIFWPEWETGLAAAAMRGSSARLVLGGLSGGACGFTISAWGCGGGILASVSVAMPCTGDD